MLSALYTTGLIPLPGGGMGYRTPESQPFTETAYDVLERVALVTATDGITTITGYAQTGDWLAKTWWNLLC